MPGWLLGRVERRTVTDMRAQAAFLNARYDEDEAAARAAPGNTWTARRRDDIAGASVYDEQWVLLYPQEYDHDKAMSGTPGATGPGYIQERRDELCAHIARHDPARVLADVAAKRQVVAHAEHWSATLRQTPEGWTAETCTVYRMAMEWTLRLLALPHAGHPDYDPAWAL